MKRPGKPEDKKKFDSYIRYSDLGFEMAIITGTGTFTGYQIDNWLNCKYPVFTIILLVLSSAGAVFYTIRNLLKK